MRFKSKRNQVELVVRKTVATLEAANSEADFLRKLAANGVAVPEVLDVRENVLYLQYIEGPTLPDFFCDEAAESLSTWLKDFYNATGEIRGDVNGRNFIFSGGKCYGVDFEEHVYGAKEEDAGKLLAFASTYSLPEEKRERFVSVLRKFLTEGLDIVQVEHFYEKELEAIKKRRF